LLSAATEIEAGRYALAAVVGIEQMRNVPGQTAAEYIGGPAMWSGNECVGVEFPWPHIFSQLGDEYDKRYGIRHEHLAQIAKVNFANARRNPNAQTRRWEFNEYSFLEDDEANPVIDGRIRKQDCGQITDGAAVLFLASIERAAEYASSRGIPLEDLPYIKGWGHHTGPITYQAKINESRDAEYVFPHVRNTIADAFRRAGFSGVEDIDGIETHDCFTTTEYMAIDHFGITPPGESWRAIEVGDIEIGGRIPVNASGGLIGLGHPVGATGIRMTLDCHKQVTGAAGDYQVENARNFATLNIGGSGTTTVSFIIGRD
jgi:acetyl-CoA C-acetyltransferase